ncbi:MAG: glycosyltransferase, partial [Kiritimatiellales bacterium]|nr:glycosyltransferase [Kiritimatiellales bacterium]
MSEAPCEISVIAPACNEEGCLPRLVEEVEKALQPTGRSYEIILVDDGSKDRTA